jgi:hypothetical protein
MPNKQEPIALTAIAALRISPRFLEPAPLCCRASYDRPGAVPNDRFQVAGPIPQQLLRIEARLQAQAASPQSTTVWQRKTAPAVV